MLDSFYSLTPHEVMDAVEASGFTITGEYMQLNSYENRVFDVILEGEYEHPDWGTNKNLIVKFYRPGRWSKECILEEHEFLTDLGEQGIPVAAPIKLNNKNTLGEHNNMYFSLFPKIMGRLPQELFPEDYQRIGRTLARLHNCGEQKVAKHRISFDSDKLLLPAIETILPWVAPEMRDRYEKACDEIYHKLSESMEGMPLQRIHGDCHLGNLLLTDQKDKAQEFFFVDFDDFIMGPVAQDFWLLFSGLDSLEEEFQWLLEGYEELRHFPMEQKSLFEPLRGFRIIHYAAWIARRWEDPSFPKIFPQFKDYTYWAEETEAIERVAWST